jgi:hypothetical protein
MASEENQIINKEKEAFKNILTKIKIDEATDLDTSFDKKCLYFICEVIYETEKCIIKFREQNKSRKTSEDVNKLQPLLQFLSKEHSNKSLEFIKIENDIEPVFNALFVFVQIDNDVENSIYKININNLSGYIFPSLMADFVDSSLLNEIKNRQTNNTFEEKKILPTSVVNNFSEKIESLKLKQNTVVEEQTSVIPTDVKILPPTEPTPTTLSRKGLKNPGNNCYLNSIIQLLYDVDDFKTAVLSENPTTLNEENKKLFDEYYNLYNINDFISSINKDKKRQFDQLVKDKDKQELKKLLIIDENGLKDKIFSKLYNEGNFKSHKEFDKKFKDYIEIKETNIKQILLELNENGKEKDLKSLLLFLLQSFFKNISAEEKNLTYEPLILPLLLFGDFNQQETDEALKKIIGILSIDDFKGFDNLGAIFNSTKYYMKDEQDFINNKGKNSVDLSDRVISNTSTKETTVPLILDNVKNDNKKLNIKTLLEKQSEPIIYGIFKPDTNINILGFTDDYYIKKNLYDKYITDNNLQSYTNNQRKEDFEKKNANTFIKDSYISFEKYVLFYLNREKYDVVLNKKSVLHTPVEIEDLIEQDGKKYKAIGVIVRLGEEGAGHFYYINYKNKKQYNDEYISELTETETETEKYWRLVLYKENDDNVNVEDVKLENIYPADNLNIDIKASDIKASEIETPDINTQNPVTSNAITFIQNPLNTKRSGVKTQGLPVSKETEIIPATRTEIKRNTIKIQTQKGGRKPLSTFRVSRKIKNKK